MPLLQTKLQDELEKFRTNFRSINVRVDNDYLVYSYKNIRHAVTSCADANFLINRLNLNLVAIHSPNSTTFLVQSNETE